MSDLGEELFRSALPGYQRHDLGGRNLLFQAGGGLSGRAAEPVPSPKRHASDPAESDLCLRHHGNFGTAVRRRRERISGPVFEAAQFGRGSVAFHSGVPGAS